MRELPFRLTFFLRDESQVFVPRCSGPMSTQARSWGCRWAEQRQMLSNKSSAYHLAAHGKAYALNSASEEVLGTQVLWGLQACLLSVTMS